MIEGGARDHRADPAGADIPAEGGRNRAPAPRAQNARAMLGGAFLAAVYRDWRDHGPQALEAVRTERPHDYVRMVASLMPKEVASRIEGDLSPELRRWLGRS